MPKGYKVFWSIFNVMKLAPFQDPLTLVEFSSKLLKTATVKRRSPFKQFVLSTVAEREEAPVPLSRTVVLRKIDALFDLSIYTDTRTQKMAFVDRFPHASALFYDSKKMLQIRIEGTLTTSCDHLDVFSQLNERQRQDYQSLLAPGSPIESFYTPLTAEHHFGQLNLKATRFDILQLHQEGHRRIQGTLNRQGELSFVNWVTP